MLTKIGQQRLFLLSIEQKIGMQGIIALCQCSLRTVRDWRREKFPMPLACAQLLSKKTKVRLPQRLGTRERYAHTHAAGEKGACVVLKKYGRVPVDEAKRKQAWHNWWEEHGKFENYSILEPKPIHIPRDSIEFAEFMGIMMGDGGMSEYQTTISLHHINDLAYSKFVARLIKKLFKVQPQIYHHPKNSVNDITVSRKALVDYLHSRGLPIGNKVAQRFDIPDWIKSKQQYAIACVRGLVDTDGSIFTHSYLVNGKRYSYKKFTFCSHSPPLQLSVAKILADLGMRPRLTKYNVRLDSIADMKRYFAIVGSHNPKHLKRYRN